MRLVPKDGTISDAESALWDLRIIILLIFIMHSFMKMYNIIKAKHQYQ